MQDPLGEFEFTLFDKKYKVNPREDLEFHASTIGESLQTQPALFAFYAVLRDEAENTVEALEAALQQKQAELYLRWQSDGSVKLTEQSFKENSRGSEEYIEIQEAIVEAKLVARKLNSFTKAFEDRRFCIVSLASRANNSAFNDADVSPRHLGRNYNQTGQTEEVPFVAPKGVGKHPSQKGK